MSEKVRRRAKIIAAGLGGAFALLVCLAALKVVTGIGPPVPGPTREAFGFRPKISHCPPGSPNGPVRLPPAGAASATWDAAGQMQQARDEPRTVVLGRRIFVLTGVELAEDRTSFRSISRFSSYDPEARAWTSLPDLPLELDHPGVAVHRGSVYVVGGFNDGLPQDAFYRYDSEEQRWDELPSLPTPRGALGTAVVGNRLYTVGGIAAYADRDRRLGAGNSYGTVEIFDFDARSWSTGPPLQVRRNHAGVASLGGAIYAVGGRDSTDGAIDAVERLDPGADSWERLAPLPLGVSSLGLVPVEGQLVAIGGGDEVERWVTPATWRFDPEDGRWHRLADLRLARHGLAASSIGGRLYVLGGSPCAGYGFTDRMESVDLTTSR